MWGNVVIAVALIAGASSAFAQDSNRPEKRSLARAEFAQTEIVPAKYADESRRDPFVPLTAGADPGDGPRFEQLRLTGVFLGTSENSLVVLEDPMKRGHFARVGERIGNARLLEIHSESADFEVDEFGSVRRQTLRLERSESADRRVR